MKTQTMMVVKTLLVLCVIQLSIAVARGETGVTAASASGIEAPRVLILTGQNNHDWRRTSPMIKEILDETGLFEATIWNGPGKATPVDQIEAPDFDQFAVVVWDYNPGGYQWPDDLRRAWVDYIRGGGKAFLIHASNNPFPGWQEFEDMVGLLWRGSGSGCSLHFDESGEAVKTEKGVGGGAGHGKIHDFVIEHRVPDHPVLAGLPARWLHANDELYHRQRGPCPDNMQVLAMAWNDASIGGTDRNEPLLWQIPYGEGLVMTWLPGHLGGGQEDISVYKCVGFRTIMKRSVEWLATGGVTQAVPADFPSEDARSLINPEEESNGP